MAYLLTKILFLLVLAAVLGGLFAWWLARRRFQDVTLEYSQMQQHWGQWKRDFEARLAERPQHDLAPVLERLEALQGAVGGIRLPAVEPVDLRPVLNAVNAIRMPVPDKVDLAPVQARLAELGSAVAAFHVPPSEPVDLQPTHARIDQLEQAVRSIVIPVPREPKEIDLSGVMSRFAALESRVAAIKLPEPAPMPAPTDLAPTNARIDRLEQAVRSIVIPVPREPKEIDLSGVMSRFAALESRVAAIKLPEPAPVPAPADLAPTNARIDRLEQAVRSIVIPVPREPKEIDLSGVMSRFAALETRVAAIKLPEPAPVPAPTDLAPTNARIDRLEQAVRSIVIPVPREPKEIDLSGVMSRFAALDARVAAIKLPEPAPVPAPADLAPTNARIDRLELAVRSIVIPVPREPKEIDLGGVMSRFAALESRVAAIKLPGARAGVPAPVDLAPLLERVDGLQRAVEALRAPGPAPAVDLTPILKQLGDLQARLDRAPARAAAAAPASAAPIPARHVRPGSANLLVSPVYGRPDDLKLIKGVANVLERMMNGIGVFYFWQIADWSAADIAHVDSLLTAFKGRITRDQWKKQARSFAALPASARRPDATAAA